MQGQIGLVTGCGHGIGRAIALRLAKLGVKVYGSDIQSEELKKVKQEIDDFGGLFESRAFDVTMPKEWDAWIDQVYTDTGAIHILVNDAGGVGGQIHHPVEQVSDTLFDHVLKINLYSTFYGIRAVSTVMKGQQYGRIINISSGAGLGKSLTGIQAYTSAKAGQIGLTRQMVYELGAFGITVNAVAPGFVVSNPATQRQWDDMGPMGQERLRNDIPLHRLGQPEDIAAVVAFLASADASYITGQVISVDGGLTMH